ncbi:hypothetical protein [Bacillus marasmi]|uniref:hypothetical protein n=1 Tax=Bacillus marasmi TaxID=1926279 RepID=UPI0011C79395|nr:hypothetical protein [Bacillus marasmi]
MDLDGLVELVYQEIVQKMVNSFPHVCIMSDTKEHELEKILVDSYQLHYFSEKNKMKYFELIVIPHLTVTMLANLANGIGATDEEQFVLSNMLQGKRVVVLQDGVEYRDYKGSSPVLLYKLYEEYERKLKGYSVLFLQKDEVLEKRELHISEAPVVAAEAVVDSTRILSQSFSLQKKLISEADLQKLYLQNIKEITVGKKCIITPLAQDFVRTHQITIIRERGNS